MTDHRDQHRSSGGGGSTDRKKSSSSRKRSRRDDKDDDRREKDRRRHKHKRERDRDDRSYASSSSSSSASSSLSSSEDDDERRRKSKKRRRGDRDEHKKDRKRSRSSKKDHKKREKKRKSKSSSKSKKHKRRGRSRSRSSSDSPSRSPSPTRQAAKASADDPLRRNHEFASALQSLLSTHLKLSTELPIILIRMAGGTTFNLSSMPDVGAARGLERVFTTLSQYGVKMDDAGSWMWDDGSGNCGGGGGSRRPGTELILIRIARTLLDGIGVTAEAAAGYEERKRREAEEREAAAAKEAAATAEEARRKQQERQLHAEAASASHESAAEQRDDSGPARSAVRMLLDKYEKRAENGGDGSSTLPSELGGIVNLILEGESIVLDGIPDEELRGDLDALFTTLGLVKAEVDEDSDDDEEDDDDGNEGNDGSPAMGFTLPDIAGANEVVRSNILAVLDECRGTQAGENGALSTNGTQTLATKKRVIGPAMGPPPGFSATDALQEYASAPAPDDSDEDDDEGPAPAGSELAKKRLRTGQSLSASTVRAMAEQRRMELEDVAAGGSGVPSVAVEGGREEWMLTPGKHDFLKGIKSADPTKSRKFKNEKARGGSSGPVDVGPQLTAQQQAEVDAIRRQVEEARGPTLIDQHRQKRAEEKEAARKSGKDKDFNWNRDRDLDAGRRVDKDHLHMVLGGAKEGLKDKFQGSISRGFM